IQTSSINQHRLNYTADTELALSEFPNVALSVAAGRWGRAVPGIRCSVLQRMACETSHPNFEAHTISSIWVSCSPVLQPESRMGSTTWVARQCVVGMKKLIGYARVSSRGQQADRQIEDLVAAGVRRDDLYVDHGVSGARTSRPGFDQALAALESGDTLVIATLDRLGRSAQSMLTFAQQLRDRGAGLRVLNLGGGDVDTSTPMGS